MKWGVGEILIPSFTFYGTASPLIPLGFTPKFVDCNPRDFQASLENFKKQVSPNTKGIMLVHIYGKIGNVEEIKIWAKSEGYFIIEDAAQALGAKRNGTLAGSFGDIAVFSTYSDKALPTGEGGLLSVEDMELHDLIS